MRLSWSQRGVWLEPETDVEREALCVLLADLKVGALPHTDSAPVSREATASSGLGQVERGLDLDL
jgi:hypothetical protein